MHFHLAGPLYWLALLFAGVASGLINVLASSGSAISLPLLLMLGLPPLNANATNRLGVLFANLTALRTFQAKKVIDWSAGLKMAIPATLGSVVGVLAAERLGGRAMALVIAAAVMLALLLLVFKLRKVIERPVEGSARLTFPGLAALFAVGFWLGFIAIDGATYLLLVMVLIFHYDLMHANALKVLMGVTCTLIPIIMFADASNIYWAQGLLMSAGSMVGGYLGARLTLHERAKFWIYRTLVLVLLLEVVHLAVQYGVPYIWMWRQRGSW